MLRFKTCSDSYLHKWDERFHALVAKHLIQHPLKPTLYENQILDPENTDWRRSHIWLHKQPMPLWIIACSLKVFGISDFAVRIPSLLLSMLSILLTYLIAKQLFNKKIALLSAFFQAINGLIIEITSGLVATDHVDLCFMVFIECAIYLIVLYNKNKRHSTLVLIGIMLGLAILSKWLPALIIVLLFYVYNNKTLISKEKLTQCFVILVIGVVIVLPWQLYAYTHFTKYYISEQQNNLQHFFTVLDGQTGSYLYYFERIRLNYNDLIYLPLIWFLYKTVKTKNNTKVFLAIWILIPIAFFSVAQTKMQGYILFIAPALFIILSAFILIIQKSAMNKILKATMIVLFFASAIITLVDRIFVATNYKQEIAIDNLKAKKHLLNSNDVILFNCDAYIEAMFYFDCTSYDFMPNAQQIEYLRSKKYKMYYFVDDFNYILKPI